MSNFEIIINDTRKLRIEKVIVVGDVLDNDGNVKMPAANAEIPAEEVESLGISDTTPIKNHVYTAED